MLHHDCLANMSKPSLERSPTRAQVPTIKGTGVPSIDLMIKRVYEPQSDADGFRVLIDRLWPRGLSKAKVAVDLCLRDVALRRRCAHGSIMIRLDGPSFVAAMLPSSIAPPPLWISCLHRLDKAG